MKGNFTCLRCGKTFARNLQTFHEEEVEEESSNEMRNDRADESSYGEDVQSEWSKADHDAHLEKNDVFRQWLDTARDDARRSRTGRFEKYLAKGMVEADAKEKAQWKMTPKIKTEFFDN